MAVFARRRIAVAVVLASLVAVLAVVGIHLLRGDPGPRPDQARPGPVLLIPGYGGSQGPLFSLASRLRARGREAIVLTLPDEGTGDLRAQAGKLDELVRAELASGEPSVDLVGYSAGGVVAKVWVDEFDGAEVARRVVTLGSPLHGTRLAAAGVAFGGASCPTACRQLAPGSDLLADHDGPVPDGLPWLSIWTENDETVQPPDSARLDGAVNVAVQELCPTVRIAHGQLPSDPRVSDLVMTALAVEPMGPPVVTCDR